MVGKGFKLALYFPRRLFQVDPTPLSRPLGTPSRPSTASRGSALRASPASELMTASQLLPASGRNYGAGNASERTMPSTGDSPEHTPERLVPVTGLDMPGSVALTLDHTRLDMPERVMPTSGHAASPDAPPSWGRPQQQLQQAKSVTPPRTPSGSRQQGAKTPGSARGRSAPYAFGYAPDTTLAVDASYAGREPEDETRSAARRTYSVVSASREPVDEPRSAARRTSSVASASKEPVDEPRSAARRTYSVASAGRESAEYDPRARRTYSVASNSRKTPVSDADHASSAAGSPGRISRAERASTGASALGRLMAMHAAQGHEYLAQAAVPIPLPGAGVPRYGEVAARMPPATAHVPVPVRGDTLVSPQVQALPSNSWQPYNAAPAPAARLSSHTGRARSAAAPYAFGYAPAGIALSMDGAGVLPGVTRPVAPSLPPTAATPSGKRISGDYGEDASRELRSKSRRVSAASGVGMTATPSSSQFRRP